MTDVICRDCGKLGTESPDDPAPALCPTCYEKRLQRITELFLPIIASLESDDITPAIVWLAKALEDIGGEKPEYARQHADTLAWAVILQTRQNEEQRRGKSRQVFHVVEMPQAWQSENSW